MIIVLIVVMLHFIIQIDLMLGVIMMNVITLSVNTLCPFMLSVIMLSGVTQTVLMLCLRHTECRYAENNYAANH